MTKYLFSWLAIGSIIIASLLCSSCEELLIDGKAASNAVENFEELWRTVDENYSFFTSKNIDWDSAYQVNHPKITEGMPRDSLFNIMADMLFALRDGHVNLFAGFDLSRNWEWYLDYPQNFDFSLVERNYLGDSYQISGPFYNSLIDSIGYIYYESFEDDFSESVLDYLITQYSSRIENNKDTVFVKGLIIDVRNNGGGSLDNARTMVSRFAEEKTLVHYWQYKNGPGHDDFTDRIPKYIEPGGEFQYQGPVIILTNRSCFSATNFFVQMMKEVMPRGRLRVVGDQTGGGGGLPLNRELSNGWIYRFSSTVTTTPAGENIEFGIKPDVEVDMDPDDMAEGKDTMLETALQIIKNAYEQNGG